MPRSPFSRVLGLQEMPLSLQPKLLRVLEEKKFSRVGSPTEIAVDVRVLAASSKDLEKAMQAGEFRDALYHRLNVVPIVLPPLRERRGDVPVLAQAMIAEFSDGLKQFLPDALELLKSREWKGTVRELRNAVERISIFVQHREIAAEEVREIGIQPGHGGFSQIAVLIRNLLEASDKGQKTLDKWF